MLKELPTLGRLERIDLRKIWTHEAHVFTPWLAAPENMSLLAESLGFEGLDLVQTEQSVEEFSADIVARMPDTGEIVLIENQLERSDHTHLGQLLTYAAGTKATAIVWIAPSFAEGHKAALEWLNEKTPDEIAFFAVEIEAWQIGDSKPAPRFNVVVEPNNWVRHVTAAIKQNTSENAANEEYWASLQSYLISHQLPHRNKNTPIKGSNYYLYWPFGTWAYLSAYISRANGYAGIYAAFNAQQGSDYDVPGLFDVLSGRKAEIEASIGAPLTFKEVKAGQLFHISGLKLPNANPAIKEDWPRQHEWIGINLEKLYSTLGPLVDSHIKEKTATLTG